MLQEQRFARGLRERRLARRRRRLRACESHFRAVHSARLAAFSLFFLALLAAAAGGRGTAGLPPRGKETDGGGRAAILWKSGTEWPEALADVAAEGKALIASGRRRIVLRFARKMDEDRLARLGVTLLRYVPRDSWIARVGEETDWAALAPDLVWAGPIPPEAKIARSIAAWTASKRAEPFPARVRFHDDVRPAEGRAILAAAGGKTLGEQALFHGFDVLLPAGGAALLAARDEVLWIGAPLPPPVVANDGIRQNGNVDSVHAPPFSFTGSGVAAGIWDGGPVYAHTDFAGRLTVADGALPVSDHATHVAGTLGGSGALSASRGGSANQWQGVAPASDLVSYDFYGDIPVEYGAAIAAHDIDLTSNSWVLDVDEAKWNNCYLYGDYDGYAPEFDEIVAGYFGKPLSIVVAAGNERNDGDCSIAARSGYACVPPPGTAKNVITVGAIHADNSAMTAFSGYGPVDDGRVKPDLVAGGCRAGYNYSIWSTWPANQYGAAFYCGTSMATPAVSGAVALLIEAWRAQGGAAKSPSAPADPLPSTVKALLLGSAGDLGNPGPDYRFGFGRMNVKRAVDRLQVATVVEDSVSDGAHREWTFPIPAGLPDLKITLVWDDPAGTPLANPALVNDLDLTLTPPSGPIVYPYVLDPANPAAAATTGRDGRNNVEQIVVSSPADGTWSARVTGTNVPVGSAQRFSLVGIDTLPPSVPDSFAASGETDSTVDLSWVRPTEADGRGVLVARSGSAITWAPPDGSVYGAGQVVTGDVTIVDTAAAPPATDRGLAAGKTYYYEAFAYDRNRNYSAGAAVTTATTGGATAVPIAPDIPRAFQLHRARPNPFNPTTALRFDLPEEGRVRLAIYALSGRLVRLLADTTLPAGAYEETWDGKDGRGGEVPSGIYFAELVAGDRRETTRLTLIR